MISHTSNKMSDIDVKYLREKGVPSLLEKIAAEIVTKKPANPELFLKEKFAMDDEGTIHKGDGIKMYIQTHDPYSAVALLAAAYVGVTVETLEAESTQDFSRLSPLQKVPVMEHQGLTVLETGAIVRYLCAATQALPVMPRNRCKVESAYEFICNNIITEALHAINERVFVPQRNSRPVDQVSVQAAVDRFKNTLQAAESLFFKESGFVVGKELSIADFALAGSCYSMQHVIGVDVATSDNYKRWWEGIQKETFYVEGLKSFMAAAMQLR